MGNPSPAWMRRRTRRPSRAWTGTRRAASSPAGACPPLSPRPRHPRPPPRRPWCTRKTVLWRTGTRRPGACSAPSTPSAGAPSRGCACMHGAPCTRTTSGAASRNSSPTSWTGSALQTAPRTALRVAHPIAPTQRLSPLTRPTISPPTCGPSTTATGTSAARIRPTTPRSRPGATRTARSGASLRATRGTARCRSGRQEHSTPRASST
mmetsp:Transcript_15793/g.48276  ORF Transcript_15793/g.48276 Transcript_15793/m.48276 type:complete len:208 (+) Transcript_15793:815-1438(+)